jgi:DNA-binding PadR family transcriptional regulator
MHHHRTDTPRGREHTGRGRHEFPWADLLGRGRGGWLYDTPRRGHGRGRGGRARRGDVRAAVLALLAEQPMYGYEIIQQLEERTQGVWRPSAGSVYPTLQLLEEQGLVTSEESGGKRRYTLTDAGRAEGQKDDRGTAPWDEVTEGIDPVRWELLRSIGQIAVATKQVAEAGSEEQQAEAVKLLAETRRRLYALLAQEG